MRMRCMLGFGTKTPGDVGDTVKKVSGNTPTGASEDDGRRYYWWIIQQVLQAVAQAEQSYDALLAQYNG